MDNYEFLKKILLSHNRYWIVLKSEFIRDNQYNDDVIFIALPTNIEIGLNYRDIKISHIENLRNSIITNNIFLSQDYAPFQTGLSFYNIVDGFAVDKLEDIKVKEVLQKVILLKVKKLYEYKKLLNIN